jgi:hypothetical protein
MSFLVQVVLLAREMWVFTLSLDLVTSITNPFASYKANLRKYHIGTVCLYILYILYIIIHIIYYYTYYTLYIIHHTLYILYLFYSIHTINNIHIIHINPPPRHMGSRSTLSLVVGQPALLPRAVYGRRVLLGNYRSLAICLLLGLFPLMGGGVLYYQCGSNGLCVCTYLTRSGEYVRYALRVCGRYIQVRAPLFTPHCMNTFYIYTNTYIIIHNNVTQHSPYPIPYTL